MLASHVVDLGSISSTRSGPLSHTRTNLILRHFFFVCWLVGLDLVIKVTLLQCSGAVFSEMFGAQTTMWGGDPTLSLACLLSLLPDSKSMFFKPLEFAAFMYNQFYPAFINII